MKKAILIILLIIVCQINAASVFFVKVDGSDTNDGVSWNSAFKSIQKAYDLAVAGDQIWVAQGIYNPTYDFNLNVGDEGKHFRLKNGVEFYGGFYGNENLLAERDYNINRTFLSGDIGIENDSTDNVYHVFYHPDGVYLDNSAVLDGFVITGGTAKAEGGDHRMGSGIHNLYSSPTIRNCEFSRNSSYGYLGGGGGIYNLYSNPIIENCIFTENFAAHDGAGIFNIVSSPKITNCKFFNNICEFGTVFNNNNSSAEYTNCEFYNNITTAGGGGMVNKDCSPIVERCIIRDNEAKMSAGGAIWNESDGCKAVISNCLIIGNSVQGSKGGLGGGIYNYDQCSPTIVNCTIANNISTNWGGGIFVRECTPNIINCIIRNNSADVLGNQIYVADKTELVVRNSCYSDSVNDLRGDIDFIDCISSEPLFSFSLEDPYELLNNSPCVDAGENSMVSSIFDYKGNIRICDGDDNGSEIVDMGCYELISESVDYEFDISGNVQLSEQTDHSGCEIIFDMQYPVDEYITFTNSDENGDYNANIVRGIYDVTFEKRHYYSVKFEDVNCYSDSTLNNVNLLMKNLLSGALSGFLPKDTYSITGNISINTSNSLEIEAGAVLEFDPGTGFNIDGVVNANGNAEDSIRFVSLKYETWEGLNLSSTADNSILNHCVIAGSGSSGIYNSGADIIVRNSRISGNNTALMGGGIVLKSDNSLIENCVLNNNGNVAIYLFGSNSICSKCEITNNRLGGVIATFCSIRIENSIIHSNSGYGLNNGDNSNTLVVNSVIYGNSGDGVTTSSSMRFINSLSCYNSSGFKNSSSAVPQEITNSCFVGNTNNFINCDSNLGVIITTNDNGDPCDVCSNITLDPKFTDGQNGDFTFLIDSPCIDAGTNSIDGYSFPAGDFMGNSRIVDGNNDTTVLVDMGCSEYQYLFVPEAPSNIQTEISSGNIVITWDLVPNAISYKIYASDDPCGGFLNVSSQGNFNGTSWSQVVSGSKLFYYVVAVTMNERILSKKEY
ncbi:MAG: right-handed parallel beta-helix repeat-containing protein [Candidatus Delongbacteria bacterium]